jgi:hypothetical protein
MVEVTAENTTQIFAAVLNAVLIRDGNVKGTPNSELIKAAVDITKEAVTVFSQNF